MHLFVDISSHGYGHLAIIAPILRALAEIEPGLRLTVRSGLPAARLGERITMPFAHIPATSDFGYRMHDALTIDFPATASAYRAAHVGWPGAIAAEARLLETLRPDAVLTSVAYLPLAGAAACGIPAFAACSLNWAELFAHFFGREPWAAAIHDEMLTAYRAATAFLRITPAMPMADLGNTTAVGPVASPGRRHDLGLGGDRAVLVALGGVDHRLPIDAWPRLSGVRWLVAGHWRCRHPDAIAWESFGLPFNDLLCSADAVMTKPGYGTFADAACNGVAVLYQRRDNWPEQDCLIEWLAANARCAEIGAAQMISGDVGAALRAVWGQPVPPPPSASGGRQAAALLADRVRNASRSA